MCYYRGLSINRILFRQYFDIEGACQRRIIVKNYLRRLELYFNIGVHGLTYLLQTHFGRTEKPRVMLDFPIKFNFGRTFSINRRLSITVHLEYILSENTR